VSAENKLRRRDWLAGLGFFAVSVGLRVPFRTRLAYTWDSVEFTQAIREYNVVLNQPHPPGYFLYVMLGRLVNKCVGDPHASLVWISVVAGSGLVAVIYLLGTAMFRRTAGVIAALVTLTSPLIWFFSCVALTYVIDALLVSIVVLCCWRAGERGGTWGDVFAIAVLMAVVGGVRQQTLLGLALLAGATLAGIQSQRLWKWVVAFVVGTVLSAAWLILMLEMTGGYAVYWSAFQATTQFHAHKTSLGGGLDAVVWNVFFAALYSAGGLMFGVVVIIAGLLVVLRQPAERRRACIEQNRAALRVMAMWILPSAAVGTLLAFTVAAGHVFTYLPGLLLFVGVVVSHVPAMWRRIGVTAAVCLLNALAFLAWPQAWNGNLWGMVHTARVLHQHDEQLTHAVNAIRAQYQPSQTVVCHLYGDLFFGLRHFQLYLPEFDQYRLTHDLAMVTPPSKPVLNVRDGKLQFVGGIDWRGKQIVLLVVPPGLGLRSFDPYFDVSAATLVEGSDGIVYELRVEHRRG
jgi:4-amino-4-deoxy-L-arabinose transferase-like glycosyltransferase